MKKKVILDTSFIISCVREKIDFFEEMYLLGFKVIIPKEVIQELKGIYLSNTKRELGKEAKVCLMLLKTHRFEEQQLNQKNVDKGIITFLKKEKDMFLATLDAELASKVKNKRLIIRGKKIEIH